MAKPVVDGIERSLAGSETRVARLSAMSQEGAALARRYGVRGLPTLIVFDGQGQPVLTEIGRLQRDAVLGAVTAQQVTAP